MYCSNCGSNLPDNSVFCQNCGASFAQTSQQPMMQQPMMQQPMMQQPMMQQPKKSKKPWIILGITLGLLVVVITTVIILLFACNGNKSSSPQELAENVFNALADNDEDDFADTFYPAALNIYNNEYADEGITVCEDLIADFYECIEDSLDLNNLNSCSISSVRILETETLSPQHTLTISSNFANTKGYIKMDSAAIIYGEVDIKVKGTKCTFEFEMYICECDGTYYLVEFDDFDIK